MTVAISPLAVQYARAIPDTHADEAHRLLEIAFERFMRLIESLEPEDWSKPTACTEWDVRDMVAHQAGGYASGASYAELLRQSKAMFKFGRLPEDNINALQIAERADKTPADLIAELKQVGPKAAHNWAHGFRAIRWMGMPHKIAGILWLRDLMWVIHSRDTWMHRLDICRATGRDFEQTREHDGRINELVVLDAARKLDGKLGNRAIRLVLTGIAGGEWRLGNGEPEAELKMDVLDFNIFVSGRFSYEEGMQRAQISGSQALIEATFKDLLILY